MMDLKGGFVDQVVVDDASMVYKRDIILNDRSWEKHYSLFFENNLDLLCIADSTGYFHRINPAFTKVLGYDAETLLSNSYLSLVHPDDIEPTLNIMRTQDQGETCVHFINRYRTASGTYKHLSWSSYPINGVLYATARDITEIVEMQNALEKLNKHLTESENKLRRITDALPVFVFQLDNDGRLSFRNSVSQKLFSDHSLPIGKPYSDVFNQETCSVINACLQELRHAHVSQKEYEFSFESEQGKLIISGVAEVFLGADGEQQGVIFTGWNVTQQRKQEEEQVQLRATATAAQEASRLKSEFLAYMSHELRTPLVGIMGIGELLYGTVSMTEEQVVLADKSRHCCQLLLNIINDILDLSKIEANKLDLNIEPFNLVKCIQDNLYVYSAKAQQKGVEVMSFIPHDVPHYIYGDKSRLEQVLGNLLSNAIKFTTEGSVVLKCRVEPASAKERLSEDGILYRTRRKYQETTLKETPVKLFFTIEDTGIGINASAQKRMFQPFSQADSSTTRNFGGTGLGLAICKKLTSLMNGDVGFLSELHHGSTFWFSISAYKCSNNDAEPVVQDERLTAKTILLMDDVENTRQVFRSYLDNWGAETIFAKDEAPYDSAIVVQHNNQANLIDVKALFKNRKKVILCSNLHVPPEVDVHSVLRLDFTRQELFNALRLCTNTHAPTSVPPTRASPKTDVLGSLLQVKRIVESRDTPVTALVVDDNSVNQDLICAILRKMGIRFDCVENGQEALDAYSRGLEHLAQGSRSYDIILMDCQMPILDGYSATMKIRELEKCRHVHTPIIALTASAMKENEERCIASGMDDFLAKPFKIASISTLLFKWLNLGGDNG
jgi:PAS domain S-box-containing protein